MRKYVTGFLIFVFVAIIAIYYISITAATKINTFNNKASSMIGKRLLIGSDTLIIIDYNLLGNTYTLSNGVKVGEQLLKDTIK